MSWLVCGRHQATSDKCQKQVEHFLEIFYRHYKLFMNCLLEENRNIIPVDSFQDILNMLLVNYQLLTMNSSK